MAWPGTVVGRRRPLIITGHFWVQKGSENEGREREKARTIAKEREATVAYQIPWPSRGDARDGGEKQRAKLERNGQKKER